jgi:hypothetical protein
VWINLGRANGAASEHLIQLCRSWQWDRAWANCDSSKSSCTMLPPEKKTPLPAPPPISFIYLRRRPPAADEFVAAGNHGGAAARRTCNAFPAGTSPGINGNG